MRRVILSSFVTFLLGASLIPSLEGQHTIQTIAGGGPNNLPALQSSVGSPSAIAQDGAGNLYIFDYDTQRVLKEDTTGTITVVAGSGVCGTFWSTSPFSEPFSCEYRLDRDAPQFGDGGPALGAQFQSWTGMAVDLAGNIYIASYCVVRKVDTYGMVSTIAGNGTCGYSGDGGSALSASLGFVNGLFVDSAGNVYIADTNNSVVREVSASTGIIARVAGNGSSGYSGDGGPATSAKMATPEGVFVDASGNLFIADDNDCVVREVAASTGIISTVAGNASLGCGYSGDGGPATGAKLIPYAIFIDAQGNIFVTDVADNLVREISVSDGTIATVAGTTRAGAGGYWGDGGLATNAALHRPYGITVDASGDVFIADWGNHVVREVSGGIITTSAGVFRWIPLIDDARKYSASAKAEEGANGNGGLVHSSRGRSSTLPMHQPRSPDVAGRGNFLLAPGSNRPIPDGSAGTLDEEGMPYLGGEGALAGDASLGYPYHMAIDNAGNIYVADKLGNDVRMISAATGTVSTIAGNGLSGFFGDGGAALSAQLSYPMGVAVDASGNVYIADSANCAVREVQAATGNIQTYAGTNHTCGFSGDGQSATSAQLGILGSISLDGSGNLFIADLGNDRIREVTAADGIIHTVAGGGSTAGNGDGSLATSAVIGAPWSVLVDGSGNLYIGDSANCVVWKVTAANGILHLFAGTYGSCGYSGDGGPATSAQIMYVFGSGYLDPAGNYFLPDAANAVIREVRAADGTISTVAGSGTAGFSGDGGDALSAQFYAPVAVAADASGNLLVADGMRVRSISGLLIPATPQVTVSADAMTFPAEPLGTAAPSSQISVTNRGSTNVSISSVVLSGTNHADFNESDNCAGQTLTAGGACKINLGYMPSLAGSESATLTITDAAGTQTISLSGAGVDFSVSVASGGSTSSTVVQGQTATYSLQVLAVGGPTQRVASPKTAYLNPSVNVTIHCTGAPAGTTCTVPSQPVVAAVGVPTAFTISVTTVAPQSNTPAKPSAAFGLRNGLSGGIALLFIGPLCVTIAGRSRRRLIWLLAPIGLVMLTIGCGDDTPQSLLVGGTQPGAYTLTVTAVSGNDSHTMQLSLTVTAAQ